MSEWDFEIEPATDDIDVPRRREFREMGIHCVHQSLRRASRITARMYDRAFAPHGLTGVQFSLLLILASSSKPMSMREIARNTSTDRTTLTRDLKTMWKKGWVVPVGHADRRRRFTAISKAGLELLNEATPAWKKTQERLTRILGVDDWDRSRRNVRRLIRRGSSLLEQGD